MNDEDRCPATNRDGERCGHPAGWGTNNDDGPCKFHGGAAENQGAPEGNANAETHGLTAEREKWFDRYRDEVEPLVRALVESYVEDAPFGFDNVAKVDMLTEVAIDQVRLRKSNDVLDDFVTEQVVGTDEDGNPIVTVDENPAHMPRARIKRDNAQILKKLGILDDPDSAQADATATLAEVIDDD
jgi:hypothetical protein